MWLSLKKKIVWLRDYLLYKKYDFKAKFNFLPFEFNPESNFVISIASYPKRAHLLPAVFQSVKEQTVQPNRVFLVLTEEEWPNKKLPKYLDKLKKEGLTILWVKGNPYSVKMMLPVLEEEPELAIVTLADDWIYKKKFVSCTVDSKPASENKIVGPLGKELYRKGEEFSMFYRARDADINTPSERLYLMGLGTYYPPYSLHSKVSNLDAIKQIVPGRGSDLWFWAAAIAKGTEQKCIGPSSVTKYTIPIPQTSKTIPKDLPGIKIMDKRFNMAIDYFGIREKLLKILPEKMENES